MDKVLLYKSDDSEDFYKVLGCDEYSDVNQIVTEYRIRALQLHPDKHVGEDNSIQCSETFTQLQKAKEILTDPVLRANYDRWRHSGLSISYKEWTAMNANGVKMSMHWATPKQRDPMIEHSSATVQQREKPISSTSQVSSQRQVGSVVWEREEGSDMLKRFRNYEI